MRWLESMIYRDKFTLLISLLFSSFVFLSACATTSNYEQADVSVHPSECKPGEKYQLLTDVFLIKVGVDSSDYRLALSPEGNYKQPYREFLTPKSIEDYKNNPIDVYVIDSAGYKHEIPILGIVTKGTRFACTKLKVEEGYSVWYGSYKIVTRLAQITDGKFAGKIVDIIDLTSPDGRQDKVVIRKPDDKLIRKLIK